MSQEQKSEAVGDTGTKNWTVANQKNAAWSDESQFVLRHADGQTEFGINSMSPWILPLSTVQAAGSGGIFFLFGHNYYTEKSNNITVMFY